MPCFIDSTLRSTQGTLNERGTGLGLKLAMEFAGLNGGTLTVSSEPDKGTIAIIAAPLAKSEI
ncbi:ATP-binding protein [Pedobacter deserti]|uniref:ATP-binding protein n=1 Tax=Pedobacter deserti TaxID=2817382 RepID=UPI00210D8D4C|nr:ATP-binding protein [Pedobacter sp. SYSU D00382]